MEYNGVLISVKRLDRILRKEVVRPCSTDALSPVWRLV